MNFQRGGEAAARRGDPVALGAAQFQLRGERGAWQLLAHKAAAENARVTMYRMMIIAYGISRAAYIGWPNCSDGCGARECATCGVCQGIGTRSGGSRPVDGNDPSLLARALGRPASTSARRARSQSLKQIPTVAATSYLIAAP